MAYGLGDHHVVEDAHLGPAGENARRFGDLLAVVLICCASQLSGGIAGTPEEKIADPARAEAWTERVVAAIHQTRPDYAWPHNLRELKKFTERAILNGGRVAAPTVSMPWVPPAPRTRPETSPAAVTSTPESSCLPSSGVLGEKAKAGEVSLEEVTRDYVTRVHVRTNQNKAETARRTGLDYRTVSRLLDPARLLRLLKKKK